MAEPNCKAGGTYSWVTDSAGNRHVRCRKHASDTDSVILNINEQSLITIIKDVFSTSGVSSNWGGNYNVESYQYISGLLGTMIVYKTNSVASAQVYYMDANGKKSALITVP